MQFLIRICLINVSNDSSLFQVSFFLLKSAPSAKACPAASLASFSSSPSSSSRSSNRASPSTEPSTSSQASSSSPFQSFTSQFRKRKTWGSSRFRTTLQNRELFSMLNCQQIKKRNKFAAVKVTWKKVETSIHKSVL